MVDKFDLSHLPQPRSAVPRAAVTGDGNVLDFPTMIRQLSDLGQRMQVAQFAGLTFKGKRDLYEALGYPRSLRIDDYRDRYKRGGIAARIVEAFPDSTWSDGAEIIEDEDPEISTQLEEDFVSLDKRLEVWSTLHRADILTGIGEFAVILIGAPGDLDTELGTMSGHEDILYLAPYAPDECSVQQYVEDPEDPRYGLPFMYKLQRKTVSAQQRKNTNFTRMVHWSRCIHIADGCLEDKVFGTPRLERVWNDLDNLDKVTGGGSEAFWKRVHQGYHWDVSPDVKLSQPEIDKLKEDAELWEHQLKRTMATRGMKLNAMGSDVSPFNNQVQSLISLISGATKIPQRILLGSERGELASSQDRENWNDRVVARRQNYGTPLVRQFVDRCIQYGALPAPADEYDVRWPEIKALTMQEQAAVAVQWAGLSAAAGGAVVTPEEIRDRVLQLDPLSPEQVAEYQAKEEAAKAAEMEKLKLKAKMIGPDGQPLGNQPPDNQPPTPPNKNQPPQPPNAGGGQ